MKGKKRRKGGRGKRERERKKSESKGKGGGREASTIRPICLQGTGGVKKEPRK